MDSRSQLEKHLFAGQYEYVDVTFSPTADTDTIIPYSILTPEDPESVRWIDVTPGDVGGTRAYVYRSSAATRVGFGRGFIALRSNVASYPTRLLLFIERT